MPQVVRAGRTQLGPSLCIRPRTSESRDTASPPCIQPEGMGERDCAVNFHAVADPEAPHGARKVTETVGGEQESMLEGRNEECACQVSLMVLDAVKLRANLFGIGVK